MITKNFIRCLMGGALVVVLGLGSAASAEIVQFQLSTEISGAQQPEGSQPWLTATFEDVIGGVQLTLDGSNLVDGEFVTGWYFNYSGDVNDLGFTAVTGPVPTLVRKTSDTDANLKADGDGYFDFKLTFANSGDASFTTGDVTTLLFTLPVGVEAADFNGTSLTGGGNGTWGSAAHVQGIGLNDGGSGWIAGNGNVVPLPAAVWGGMALCGFIGAAKIRRRQNSDSAA